MGHILPALFLIAVTTNFWKLQRAFRNFLSSAVTIFGLSNSVFVFVFFLGGAKMAKIDIINPKLIVPHQLCTSPNFLTLQMAGGQILPALRKIAFFAPFCNLIDPKKFDFSQIYMTMHPIHFQRLKMV